MFKVFIAHPIPSAGLRMLAELDVQLNDQAGPLGHALLVQAAHKADAIITLVSDQVDDDLFDACPNLKLVANYAVGTDNIDLVAAAVHKVIVTNTPDVLTEAVAEHTIALLMASARRIVEADRYMRSGQYKMWASDLFLGAELKDMTLGVVGCGRIGARVAQIAHDGLGMDIVYYDTAPNEMIERRLQARRLTLERLLKEADVVSVHVPLLPSTRHLISAAELKAMKPSALLINTSRGPVIDESALVSALKESAIRGAALDVYEHEPQMAPGLAALDNVVLTPHVASATVRARDAMARITAQAVLDVAAGRKPKNVVGR